MKINVKEDEENTVNEPKKEEVKSVPSTNNKRSKKSSLKNKISKVSIKKPNFKKSDAKKPNLKKPNLKNIKVDKKLLFVVACTAVVVVIVIVLVALFGTPKIEDSYFVSDENKDVITLEVSKADAATTNLIQTHIVYTYADDQITSLKTYYEYENNELASQAFENTKSINQNAESVDLNDKYIVVTAKSDQYKSLTPSDIKQQAEAIRQFQAAQKESEEKSEEKTEE